MVFHELYVALDNFQYDGLKFQKKDMLWLPHEAQGKCLWQSNQMSG